jgi:hypothetical protein
MTRNKPASAAGASWKKQPLAEGISNELSEKYRVPRKIGRLWLQNDYLLPLLDGLDEIDTVMQPALRCHDQLVYRRV